MLNLSSGNRSAVTSSARQSVTKEPSASAEGANDREINPLVHEASEKKRSSQFSKWQAIFQRPSTWQKNQPSPGPSSASHRGRPPSEHGVKGGAHRTNAQDEESRSLGKDGRSVARQEASEAQTPRSSSKPRAGTSAQRPAPAKNHQRIDWSSVEASSQLSLAMTACAEGLLSTRKATRELGVPYSVLQRRTSGLLSTDASLGSNQVLPKALETKLHDHILQLADLGFYLGRQVPCCEARKSFRHCR